MKILYVAVILLFNFKVDYLSIKGIKSTYNKEDHIAYSIFNQANKSQFIDVALEMKANEGWNEVVIDATRATSFKSTIVYEIKQYSSKSFSLDLREIDNHILKNKQLTLRFKVNYRDKIDTKKSSSIYSNSFLIKQ